MTWLGSPCFDTENAPVSRRRDTISGLEYILVTYLCTVSDEDAKAHYLARNGGNGCANNDFPVISPPDKAFVSTGIHSNAAATLLNYPIVVAYWHARSLVRITTKHQNVTSLRFASTFHFGFGASMIYRTNVKVFANTLAMV